jgi:hypothetical protein
MTIIHFTSAAHQFAKALAEGDLHRALGVPEDARKLDIDVAATRIYDHMPQIAARAAVVANVLTNRDRRAIYQSLRELRDCVCQTVADQYGNKLLEMIPDYRAAIWDKCCELLKFSLDQTDLLVGPRGSESLAKVGEEWVLESVLISRLIVLKCTREQLLAGLVTCELWYAECPVCHHRRKVVCKRKDDRSPPSSGPEYEGLRLNGKYDRNRYNCYMGRCPTCRARGGDPSIYDDTYTFRFPSESPRGSIVQGDGHRGGTVIYAILNSFPGSNWLPRLLPDFYRTQQYGVDFTLYEEEPTFQPKRRRARVDKSKYINPRTELICCLGCGRDTRAMSGFCGRCVGKIANRCSADEEEGRSVLSPEVLEGTSIEYEFRDSFADEQYHGYSRDDV